jgi:hypothetical protein
LQAKTPPEQVAFFFPFFFTRAIAPHMGAHACTPKWRAFVDVLE